LVKFIFFLLLAFFQINLLFAQSTQPTEWREEWTTNNPSPQVQLLNASPKFLCENVTEVGLYDALEYRTRYLFNIESVDSNPENEMNCVSIAPISGAIEARWKISKVCVEYSGGVRTTNSYTGSCLIDTDCSDCSGAGETILVGNPVELPSLAKTVTETDWQSPIDPRLRTH
jgi:hypothetical protein